MVARPQLRGLGLDDDRIDRALSAGRLHRVHQGVYAVGHSRLSHLGRWSAAVLACGHEAALGYRSAAALLELRSSSATRTEVVLASRSRRAHRDVRVYCHAGLQPDELTVRDGIPVTTVARTLLDLASVVSPHQLRRAVSQAEVLGVFDLAAVQTLLDRHPRHRGARALRDVLRSWDEPDLLRSPLERAFLELCARHGLPKPVMNGTALGMEIDAQFPDHEVAVELDGARFHRGVLKREDDYAKRARIEAEGWRFVAFTYRQVTDDGGDFPARILHRMFARQPPSSDSGQDLPRIPR